MAALEIADGVDALDIEVDRASKVGLADAHLLDQNILLVVSCVPGIFLISLLQRGVTCFSVESLKFVCLTYLQYGDLFGHVYTRQFWQQSRP